MKSLKAINEFINTRPIALVGVSRNKKKFGYQVYKRLIDNGLNVLPVNPNTDMIDDNRCYKDIESLPSEVKSVIIMTSKKETDNIVSESIKKGVSNIWIQQHSDTKSAVELANSNGINLITGECILMYIKPDGLHKFHVFLKKLFGTYPR